MCRVISHIDVDMLSLWPCVMGGATTQRVSSVIEQRVSNLCIHICIGLSLVISPALRQIPKAVLFGVFLYMVEHCKFKRVETRVESA